jgi:hypothetical protein
MSFAVNFNNQRKFVLGRNAIYLLNSGYLRGNDDMPELSACKSESLNPKNSVLYRGLANANLAEVGGR